jgi:membrane protein required for colicin V production
MSWLDIIILIPLLIGLVMGLVRGLLIEVVSIAAIGIGYICSKIFSAVVASWLMTSFNWNEAVCSVVAYAVIFIIVVLGLILLAKLLTKAVKKITLGWANRLLGGLFGMLKWSVIVLIVVLCIHRLDKQFNFISQDLKDQSVVYMQAAPIAEKMWQNITLQINEYQANQQTNK